MATNHTTNYQLNLWEPGDSFLREEFNENTEMIDEALKAETQRIDTALASKFDPGNMPWVTGTYQELITEPVTVTLGFRPSLVIFVALGAVGMGISVGEYSVMTGRNRNVSGTVTQGFSCQFQDDGFTLPARSYYFNDDERYLQIRYIAFR